VLQITYFTNFNKEGGKKEKLAISNRSGKVKEGYGGGKKKRGLCHAFYFLRGVGKRKNTISGNKPQTEEEGKGKKKRGTSAAW